MLAPLVWLAVFLCNLGLASIQMYIVCAG